MKFRDKVYELVKRIPKGKVMTYGGIARALNSKAYRAVGQALKKNEFPEIIPCFKVVKSDGSIGGYNGSDPKKIKKKIKILREEGIIVKKNKIDISKYFYKFKD